MPNSFLFLIKWTAWFWHHSTTIYYYYSPISWKFLLFMQRVICNRWVQIHNRLKMCMQVMNLYSYTIIDTCSCKKKKRSSAPKSVHVCVQTLNPPLRLVPGVCRYQRASWHIHVAAYEGGLRVFCPAPHGSETEMCRPLGEFHFTYSVAVRPDQTPPERRRNPNAVPPHTQLTVPARSTVWGIWGKKVLFNPVYKCFTCR